MLNELDEEILDSSENYKYLSDDENVRRRPSTNNEQDLSTVQTIETEF